MLPWPEVCRKFNLTPADRRIYHSVIAGFPPEWRDLLSRPDPITKKSEFLGVFWAKTNHAPYVVFETTKSSDLDFRVKKPVPFSRLTWPLIRSG
jgi:hypothetical protein